MGDIMNMLRQSMWIPEPAIIGKNTPDQSGKVHIVTGGYGGCGLELAKLLYAANATVYIFGRSASKGQEAVKTLQATSAQSQGTVEFIEVDLSDLKTIKPAVEAFKKKESQLHVLTNNAGVMMPPKGSIDAQGLELQMGTNCVGPFLLAKLLRPILEETAKRSAPGTVRVTWAGSVGVDMLSYKPGGLKLDDKGKPEILDVNTNYGQSKAGNVYISCESARRFRDSGVIHVAWNPGNLGSDLSRHMGALAKISTSLLTYKPIFGAYTELYAAVSPDITSEKNGSYIVPWGRPGTYRNDIVQAIKPTNEGGEGKAQKFWDWLEETTSPYS